MKFVRGPAPSPGPPHHPPTPHTWAIPSPPPSHNPYLGQQQCHWVPQVAVEHGDSPRHQPPRDGGTDLHHSGEGPAGRGGGKLAGAPKCFTLAPPHHLRTHTHLPPPQHTCAPEPLPPPPAASPWCRGCGCGCPPSEPPHPPAPPPGRGHTAGGEGGGETGRTDMSLVRGHGLSRATRRGGGAESTLPCCMEVD